MLEFIEVPVRTHIIEGTSGSREFRLSTNYGSFYARYWCVNDRWNAFVYYCIGDDIEIHRGVPFVLDNMDEAGVVAWIERAFEEGPMFAVPVIEHLEVAP